MPVAAAIDEQAGPAAIAAAAATGREAVAIHLGPGVAETGALFQPLQQLFSLCFGSRQLFRVCKDQLVVQETVLATVGVDQLQLNAFIET